MNEVNEMVIKAHYANPILPEDESEPWSAHRYSILRDASGNDPDFLKWATISATMHTGWSPSINEQSQYCMGFDCSDTDFGGSIITPLWPGYVTTGTCIDQAYNLLHYLQAMGMAQLNVRRSSWTITQPKGPWYITEIGGGYGKLCQLFLRTFPGMVADYTIIDLPELSAIQKYYLKHEVSREDFNSINFVTVPTVRTEKVDLFIASNSLTEINNEHTKNSFFDANPARSYLLRYNGDFGTASWVAKKKEQLSAWYGITWSEPVHVPCMQIIDIGL